MILGKYLLGIIRGKKSKNKIGILLMAKLMTMI
jgi:hypothetical protein